MTREPSEGEVMVFTIGGGFVVKGSMREVVEKLAAEDWPWFELAESSDKIIIRSTQVVVLREGTRSRKGGIGFVHGP
jgi:hypothetical protein